MDGHKTAWKLTLAYDGTDFHGWQIQPGKPTIQRTLAEAIANITSERVLPQGSGRTDAGVHAEGQVASFELAAPIPPDNLQRALNRILPSSIRVATAEHAPPGFHARHSAVAKTYRYRIFQGPVCPPFLSRYVSRRELPLELEAMQAAARQVTGEHDFTSFAASDPDRNARIQSMHQPDAAPTGKLGNIRCIELSEWATAELPSFEPLHCIPEESFLWVYTVRGNGFLHHMVRNLVGTFLEIGAGRLSPGDIPAILNARDRGMAGPTAPACGLCLVNVQYGTRDCAGCPAGEV
ncbi:MAG TPA: tRNA pseudouridine synthase A [Acidobacteriaceae bacterium]|nr:tRNA pseudouridine synthase A [Acidobacteriaceae bacterium]